MEPVAYPIVYRQVIEMVAACGDAIAKITDGIKHAVETGVAGYDYVAARREHKRLRDLSAGATYLSRTWQALTVADIDEYLAKPKPTEADWGTIRVVIVNIATGVQGILGDVRRERSDFVLEETYSKITETLHGRILLLDELLRIPQPKTKKEKEALKMINTEYKRLLNEFQKAIQQLNLYLKQKKHS